MTTTCDTDPNTQTIAAAWASSPLGQPEGEVPSGFATAGPTEPVTARADERSAKRPAPQGGRDPRRVSTDRKERLLAE